MKKVKQIIVIFSDGTTEVTEVNGLATEPSVPPTPSSPAHTPIIVTPVNKRPVEIENKSYPSVSNASAETGYSRYIIVVRCASPEYTDWKFV